MAQAAPEAKPKPDEPFVIKRVLPIDGPIKYGQWFWNDAGVPQGPLVITVDLDARVLSVFRDGDGVAIHGGHAVELGWASHGCIGAPNPFMTKLFAVAQVGDKAIITRGKRAGVGDALIET